MINMKNNNVSFPINVLAPLDQQNPERFNKKLDRSKYGRLEGVL